MSSIKVKYCSIYNWNNIYSKDCQCKQTMHLIPFFCNSSLDSFFSTYVSPYLERSTEVKAAPKSRLSLYS